MHCTHDQRIKCDMAGLGVAIICSYNMQWIWMYVGQTKEILEI